MTYYIDSDFKVHVNDTGGLTPVELSFEGKCDEFIDGHRFIPEGKSWIGEDGFVYTGVMMCTWRDFAELDAIQREYELELREEYEYLLGEYETAFEEIEAALEV